MIKRFILGIALLSIMFNLASCTQKEIQNEIQDEKPVIYLYTEKPEEVNVKLDYDGELVFTYPEYKNGWNVLTRPDGTIQDLKTKELYSYLFWEGSSDYEWNIEEGFVVKGEDVVEFLKEKLSYMGLNEKEYNEFIVYWGPRMQKNKYNLIHFAKEEYENIARLNITPEPDSILRVFMVYEALDDDTYIKEQELEPFERRGFTVVEWGGRELKN